MKLSPFLSHTEIQQMTQTLGSAITKDYRKCLDTDEELLVIVTLKGAMYFAADLTREIQLPIHLDFIRLASYGSGTQSSGNVRIVKDIESTPEGRHILVIDEIVDSGRTLSFLFDRLKAQNPQSLKLCALLSKPSRREVSVHVDYLGREIEDKFVVGYGLDYKEQFRNRKDILAVEL